MTIQAFSERVGVAKSAIRYYEEKGLLGPVERSEGGYRLYREDQIKTVRLITSLRMADISIADIQMYLNETNTSKRQQMMADWIHSIKKRRDVLDTSLRYLKGNSLNERIYLIEKERETVIWFPAISRIGKFGELFMEKAEELKKRNVPIQNSYLKYISGLDLIQAEIGFSVPPTTDTTWMSGDVYKEEMASAMCIAMPFTGSFENIQDGYEKLFNYAVTHDWLPTGDVVEWYRGNDLSTVELLLPVTDIVKRGV
ncbi:MerR family transcriptional regulator [Sporosarcina sp. ACRSL]|uniref:MerR family transcriptional regulator n=1 Tax=Sporosarcina sp. ACRSL TaxID=2918215 RepID=UPI001EF54090|nr:MerR family transcriptional regulator [Sporosarcina sp. ACRSL]MCG7343393.1 MerR family transcriptional regulator [Sporosarcina sp. ACRSL]